MAGARPVFADIDPDRLTLDPARGGGGDHAAHRGDHAGAPLRPAGRHAARSPRSPRGTIWRSSRTAARRTWRRATGGRSARFGAAAAYSFYPTKNLGALGDGGAMHDRRRGARGAATAAAQRRPDRSLSPRRVRRELAARRDAGGGPARAACRCCRGGRRRRRELAARLPRGARRRRRSSCRRSAIAGHVYHLFPVLSGDRDGAAGAPASARHRDADPLPGPDSAAAGARIGSARRLPGRRSRVRRGVVAAALPGHSGALTPVAARRRTGARGAAERRAALTRAPPLAPRAHAALPRDPRRAVRAVRDGAAHVGTLRGGARVPGPVRRRPAAGYRLKPNARVRFTTAEFDTEIAINDAGRPRRRGRSARSRRTSGASCVLGDSLVLSVQVPFEQTFGELLERRLNAAGGALPLPRDQRRRAGLRPGRGAAVLRARRAGARSRTWCIDDGVRRQRRGGGGRVARRGCDGDARRAERRRRTTRARACGGSCAGAWCCRCCGCASCRPPTGSRRADGARAAAPELRGATRAADRARAAQSRGVRQRDRRESRRASARGRRSC